VTEPSAALHQPFSGPVLEAPGAARVVDATLGHGGHAERFGQRVPRCGIDGTRRDQDARARLGDDGVAT
jgi:16S rRNA C1402 N4-methylase RsmH